MIFHKTKKTNIKYVLTVLVILLAAPLVAQENIPKKIIYETDMCADVDDVGGLASLHALANNGEIELLAVCFNEVHTYGAPAIDAINTWYGRGDIPVGIYKGNLDHPHGSNYLEYVAAFPHDLEKGDAPDALDVYVAVLSEQPDSSVTIVSVGFLNNLNDLLKAEPELVAQKVKELVIMAGVYNDGFNLTQHNLVSASENVIRNWPTPLVISQEGSSIQTGDDLQFTPEENPVREGYYRYFRGNYENRSSWDQMAVLYGVRGLSSYFNQITTGSGRLPNGYVWQMEPGFRSYLSNKLSNSSYVRIIEELMVQRPIGAHFNMSSQIGWLPFTVEFDASISVVGGGLTIQQYIWDFGDGSCGDGEIVIHEYTNSGTFDVKLTVVNNDGDSLKTAGQVFVSDPIFSSEQFWGDIRNYDVNQPELWSTEVDSGNMRLFLNNESRNFEISLPGFCFVKDSVYNDFDMSFNVRTGENLSQNSLADYRIIFGYKDEKNYNYLLIKQTTSRLVNVDNGQSISIAWTSDDGIPDAGYHRVDINLKGSQLNVMLDETTYLSANSSRLSAEGRIGFGSEKYAAFFDDILITRKQDYIGISHQGNQPAQFNLWQNYPNPFNPSTRIKFSLPKADYVKIEVYNLIGQKIITLLNQYMTAGLHNVEFNGQDLLSGVYWYKIETKDFQDVKKMILLK